MLVSVMTQLCGACRPVRQRGSSDAYVTGRPRTRRPGFCEDVEGSSSYLWPFAVPVGARLEFFPHREQHVFRECRSYELDGDGHSVGETAGQRECREPGEIASGCQRAQTGV